MVVLRFVRAGLLAALVAGVPCLAEGRPNLDPQRIGRLSRYDVLLFSDHADAGGWRHRALGVFDASPEQVYQVVKSYEHYSEYVPRVTESRVTWDGNDALVTLTADLPWPVSNIRVHARFQHDSPSAETYRVRFGMLRGNLQRYEGSLLIEPWGNGKATVTYELMAEPDSRLPRSWLQHAVGHGVSNFVHCLRNRVNLLQRQGALHGLSSSAGGRPQPSPPLASAPPDILPVPPAPGHIGSFGADEREP